MPADVVIHPVEALASNFVRMVEETSREAIAARGSFSIAVPGGSTAEHLLPALVAASVPWDRVSVFWVDERMVPPTDPASNFRLAQTGWLDRVAVPAKNVHRMRGEDPDPRGAAAAYARTLREQLGESPRFDMVLLGMGADGHVASLFPGHRLLRAWDREVAVLDDAPKAPPSRMTLTLKALTATGQTVVFATGRSKAPAIADALGNEDSELPVALATLGSGTVTYLLDTAAASGL